MKPTINIAKKSNYIDSWTISSQEWNVFVKEAKSLKKEDNIYMGIATLIVGIPFLMLSKKIAFLMAIVFVIPFAILVPWVRNKIATSHLKLKNEKAVVQFYPDYLMINDKKIDLFLNNRWIRNMKISDGKNGLKLLEIEIAWETRKGDTFDETRIPIPADNIENAREIIEFYRKYKS